MYLNDLTFFYYPLPLCLRVGSLQQSLPTLDFISNAATQGTPTPQAPHFFELQAGNAIFSGWVKGRDISFSERDIPPLLSALLRRAERIARSGEQIPLLCSQTRSHTL